MRWTVCCNVYIASCLACSNGQSVEEYCAENMHGDVPGVQNIIITITPRGRKVTKQLKKNTSSP